jgi:hypothetical protein
MKKKKKVRKDANVLGVAAPADVIGVEDHCRYYSEKNTSMED